MKISLPNGNIYTGGPIELGGGLAIQSNLKNTYTGIEKSLRTSLIDILKLDASISNEGIFDALDSVILFDKLKKEKLKLTKEIAQLTIDGFIDKKMLDATLRDSFIKLAIENYETTVEVINNQYQRHLELNELIKLSGRELYLSGKLERLKVLSEDHFLLKYKELSDRNFKEPETKTISVNDSNIKEEMTNDDLLKLSGKELYMMGKLETLKEFNYEVFKLKYREYFGIEFKA